LVNVTKLILVFAIIFFPKTI